jgi:hypothetical protein
MVLISFVILRLIDLPAVGQSQVAVPLETVFLTPPWSFLPLAFGPAVEWVFVLVGKNWYYSALLFRKH